MEKDDQNKKKESKFIAYITGKGFYKVIGLCIALVVLAAWFITSVYKNRVGGEVQGTSSAVTSEAASQTGGITFESGLSSELFGPTANQSSQATVPANQTSEDAAAANASAAAAAESEDTGTAEEFLFIMPASGEIIREYSAGLPVYSPTFSDWRVHNAVDIAGEAGTPVRAMAAGTVTAITSDMLWGTTIVITHENGYVSKYCGLGTKPTVKVDSVVEVGQVIGSIGTTAQAEAADKPHLHFSLTKDGLSVNPIEVIAAIN
ncbi:MAG TPA: M23 family metallopeptidase [Oscillospiraceae bacterium]|nr:M23 family metallopeptidase [Oscillospiraceae bacterium]HPS35612.1 M23 family metallopeptidase [Oscillospiraceae bacterium]